MRKQWIEFCGRGQRWVPGASSKRSGRVKARTVPKSSLKRCGEDLTEANKKVFQVLVFLYYVYTHGQCCGSGMFIPDPGSDFFHPGSRTQTVSIPDPRSASKNLSILTPITKKNGF